MEQEVVNLGAQPHARFEVVFQDKSGEVKRVEVDANNFADAAWRVANSTFDTFHPSGRELLDVIRLR